MADAPLLTIGTRGSPLALVQTNEVRDKLQAAEPSLARDGALEIQVNWFPHCIWFVPTEADAAHLVSEGENRGRIWTARELADLTSVPGLNLEEIRTIQAVKDEFDGYLAGVRKAESRNAP